MPNMEVVINVPVKHLDVKFDAAKGAAVKKLRNTYVWTDATYEGVEGRTIGDNAYYAYSFTLTNGRLITKK